MFALVKCFQPSLLYDGKARSLTLSGASFKCHSWVGCHVIGYRFLSTKYNLKNWDLFHANAPCFHFKKFRKKFVRRFLYIHPGPKYLNGKHLSWWIFKEINIKWEIYSLFSNNFQEEAIFEYLMKTVLSRQLPIREGALPSTFVSCQCKTF